MSELYLWLDGQTRNPARKTQNCNACGNCCDFDSYGHRLYVTPPELIYLAANLDGWHGQKRSVAMKNLKPMTSGRCPYQVDNKCSVHDFRFASCRIFFCRGSSEQQSQLSEETLEKLKALCTEFDIPYRYCDLKTALDQM